MSVTGAGLAATVTARAAGASPSITNYVGPGISQPAAIALGPDGALWFANIGTDSIGRMTSTGVVTNYRDPSIQATNGITAGPDGALWFTNYSGSIGRITTDGTV